jgi:hypothetical protein
MYPDQHQQLPSLSTNSVGKCWKQILTLFAPATRFEQDGSDEESEAADDD